MTVRTDVNVTTVICSGPVLVSVSLSYVKYWLMASIVSCLSSTPATSWIGIGGKMQNDRSLIYRPFALEESVIVRVGQRWSVQSICTDYPYSQPFPVYQSTDEINCYVNHRMMNSINYLLSLLKLFMSGSRDRLKVYSTHFWFFRMKGHAYFPL